MLNLLNSALRKKILSETLGQENVDRKSLSSGQLEIYKDRINAQVKKYLQGFYSEETIKNTPIVSSVNLARRMVKEEASLYQRKPKREFTGVTEEQAAVLEQVYKDMKADTILRSANEFYKLQQQNHLYAIPRNKKIKLCSYLGHQLDVVPSTEDSEIGEVYLINGFNRTLANQRVSDSENGYDELIADVDDYLQAMKAIAWWSPKFNFITNEEGDILQSETYENQLNGMLPFIDIHSRKDGEYWVRSGASLTDFTIQFNAALTDMGNVVRMQGFGQAWLKAPKELMPQNIQIGPNFILRLPMDPNQETATDFGFANANPDIAGSLQYLEGLLSSFLTSRGVDPKVVNAKMESERYASGFERMLAMIDQFEASEEDIDVFQEVEKKLFKLVVQYLNTYANSDVLEYKIAPIPEDASVNITYAKPQSIVSDSEKLANIQMRMDMQLIDPVEAIAVDREIPYDDAKEIFDRIQKMQPKLPEPDPNKGA
jgi:hypothetical protein